MWSSFGSTIPNFVLQSDAINVVDKLLYGYIVALCGMPDSHIVKVDMVKASESIGVDLDTAIESLVFLENACFYHKVITDTDKPDVYVVDLRVDAALIGKYEAENKRFELGDDRG